MAIAAPGTVTRREREVDRQLDRPFHVFLWNDPVTPMQVVVLILKRIFGFDGEKATELMLVAHRQGKVVVWTGERDQAVRYAIELGTAGLQSTVGRDA